MPDTNLGDGLVVIHRNPQHLDTYSSAAKVPFPYIGEATESDWVFANLCEITGDDV